MKSTNYELRVSFIDFLCDLESIKLYDIKHLIEISFAFNFTLEVEALQVEFLKPHVSTEP